MLWNDRLFASVPLAPVWLGLALALLLLGLFLALMWLTGLLTEFLASDTQVWENRDARLGVLLILFAAGLPTVRRYAALGARANYEALRPLLGGEASDSRLAPRALDTRTVRGARTAGAIGLAIMPLIGLMVDRDPALYATREYWGPAQMWVWSIGLIVAWNAGRFMYESLDDARCFSTLAAHLRDLNLLNLEPLSPFARQGLLSALPWVIFVSIFALNAIDQGFVWVVTVSAPLSLAGATTALLLPVRGVRERIRAAKHEELRRIAAALRGDAEALRGSAIAKRKEVSVADLLAYRSFVESVREWPFDTPARLRFAFYLALPIGSWLGGALMERVLVVFWD